jgi:phosphoribosyl-AMP cyclohydrolase
MIELEDYCYKFLVTNVNLEGLNSGTDLNFFKTLVGKTKNDIMVAGGITSIEEIKYIHKLGFDQVLGMAITSGRLNIMECYIEIIDFEKQNGLIPTIVQDIDTKEVLMLAYSNKESLKKTYDTKKATYYSRSRNTLWTKGEKSGNIQYIEKIHLDCDSDTILFQVKQKGVACHRDKRTCFEI